MADRHDDAPSGSNRRAETPARSPALAFPERGVGWEGNLAGARSQACPACGYVKGGDASD
jgi:hypothetical protein